MQSKTLYADIWPQQPDTLRQQDQVILCRTAMACDEWLERQRDESIQIGASSHDSPF